MGFVDETAWTVAAYQRGLPGIYFVETVKRGGMIPSAVATYTQKLMDKYDTRDVVIDSGGLGKGYQMEMHEKYGIWCEPAQKSQKRGFQAVVSGELRSGNIKVHPQACSALVDEMLQLVWEDEKREKESQELDNHACDSMLYNVRNVTHWYKPEMVEDELDHAGRMRKVVSDDRKRVRSGILKSKRVRDKKRLWARDISRWN